MCVNLDIVVQGNHQDVKVGVVFFYWRRTPYINCPIDIDECREGKCQNGRCSNTPGSFNCVCPQGFDVSPDGNYCTDHDECSEIGMCTNGICINMDGSFKCQCRSGYKLSPSGYACVGTYAI